MIHVLELSFSGARRLFFELRSNSKAINISNRARHLFKDHPERQWTAMEIVRLISKGKGSFEKNEQPSAWEHSWLWITEDEDERKCTFALRFEEEDDEKTMLVITAIR